MADSKMDFVREFQRVLLEKYEPDEAKNIIDILLPCIEGYEVTPAERQLAVVETETERLTSLFLATKRIEGRAESTLKRYSYEIRRMFKVINRPIGDVDVMVLRSYLAHLGTHGTSINSIAGIRSIICSFFGWLHREGLLQNNPSAQLGIVKKRINVELPFSGNDIEVMRASCKSVRDRALIEFMLSTGCRINEVTSLNRYDIDFKNMECVVVGKGSKERKVYLTDVCALHLRMYLKSRTDGSEALFAGRGSDRITNSAVRMMLKRLVTATGVTNIHPHRFRRTVATNLIRRGMPVQDVARVLGHSNVNTTLRYVYINDDIIKHKYNLIAA